MLDTSSTCLHATCTCRYKTATSPGRTASMAALVTLDTSSVCLQVICTWRYITATSPGCTVSMTTSWRSTLPLLVSTWPVPGDTHQQHHQVVQHHQQSSCSFCFLSHPQLVLPKMTTSIPNTSWSQSRPCHFSPPSPSVGFHRCTIYSRTTGRKPSQQSTETKCAFNVYNGKEEHNKQQKLKASTKWKLVLGTSLKHSPSATFLQHTKTAGRVLRDTHQHPVHWPFHHFWRSLIHADDVPLLGHSVQEHVLPELHLVPHATPFLACSQPHSGWKASKSSRRRWKRRKKRKRSRRRSWKKKEKKQEKQEKKEKQVKKKMKEEGGRQGGWGGGEKGRKKRKEKKKKPIKRKITASYKHFCLRKVFFNRVFHYTPMVQINPSPQVGKVFNAHSTVQVTPWRYETEQSNAIHPLKMCLYNTLCPTNTRATLLTHKPLEDVGLAHILPGERTGVH